MRSLLIPLVLLLLFTLSEDVSAQVTPKATIRGRVVDDSTGTPLPLANVFVSNSTIGTSADADGRFELKGVPIGFQQIVASIVSYKPMSINVQLSDSLVRVVEFRLKAQPVQISAVDVEAKDPVEWKKHLQKFLETFFGKTKNAERCRIMNPEVLDFSFDEENEQLTATARAPIEIDNQALGYHVRLILVLFMNNRTRYQFIALSAFAPLKPKSFVEGEEWKSNRLDAYYGSKRHFLRSLIRKSTSAEGFDVNNLRHDWVGNAMMGPVGFAVSPDALVAPGDTQYEFKLEFRDYLQVIYRRENKMLISLIEMNTPTVIVFPNGLTANPLGLWTSGYWATQRVAEMLPIDYEPTSAAN
ncbi:MAG TPA: carboxypeptidase-like regulatory domain-containing protein [Bacteroidota bacterium]|nr:carboxypeptidase-like regulatory domain-containing protein [Bacteroidota bacterium]